MESELAVRVCNISTRKMGHWGSWPSHSVMMKLKLLSVNENFRNLQERMVSTQFKNIYIYWGMDKR